jgi:hypothetical protein
MAPKKPAAKEKGKGGKSPGSERQPGRSPQTQSPMEPDAPNKRVKRDVTPNQKNNATAADVSQATQPGPETPRTPKARKPATTDSQTKQKDHGKSESVPPKTNGKSTTTGQDEGAPAAAAGDEATVDVCTRALDGDDTARERVVDIIVKCVVGRTELHDFETDSRIAGRVSLDLVRASVCGSDGGGCLAREVDGVWELVDESQVSTLLACGADVRAAYITY